uniref:Uncharacterized protein n=1 Tax=Anguilla anguilla TaxID=7936 RepID=A0A0E9USM4_ANGAN
MSKRVPPKGSSIVKLPVGTASEGPAAFAVFLPFRCPLVAVSIWQTRAPASD